MPHQWRLVRVFAGNHQKEEKGCLTRFSPPTFQVTVTFAGRNCEHVVWPDLQPEEQPLVYVVQDEMAVHANDDCPWEWHEEGKMSLKKKDRGGLAMVSEFLSELGGRLRCSDAEAQAYAALHPDSRIAALVSGSKRVEARLILQPGAAAHKDDYFDNKQLLEQTKLALEIFDAMDRHIMPKRTIVSNPVGAALSLTRDGKVKLQLSALQSTERELPAIRCRAIPLFDHSSGHEAGAADSRSVTAMPKGPDWNAKMPPMRAGYFLIGQQRCVQEMQFKMGDVLACDVKVPAGIDPEGEPATGGAAAPPAILPEQLLERRVLYEHESLSYDGKVTGVDGDKLVVELGPSQLEMSVAEVLECLVGPAPEPQVHTEAPPTAEETAAAMKIYMKNRKQTLMKKDEHKTKTAAQLEEVMKAEWPQLLEARQLGYVRKVREAAARGGGAQRQAPTVLKKGSTVPRMLIGRHKGSEVLLAERGLLPSGSLRGCCEAGQHTSDNKCCCKRLLGAQPDFKVRSAARQHNATPHLAPALHRLTSLPPPRR